MASDSLSPAAKALRDQLYGLQPELAGLRLRYLSLCAGGVLALAVIATGGLFAFYPHAAAIFPLAVLLPMLPSFAVYRLANRMYAARARDMIIETLTYSSGLNVRPEGYVLASDVEPHRIVPAFTDVAMKDGFDGVYNGLPVTVQTMILATASGSIGGILARVKLKHVSGGHTVIVTGNALKAYFRDRFASFGKVGAANGAFDKQMEIFTTDRVEARLIACTPVLEAMMDSAGSLRARWFAASFLGPVAYVFFACPRATVEPPALWSGVNRAAMQAVFEPFECLFRLADGIRSMK